MKIANPLRRAGGYGADRVGNANISGVGEERADRPMWGKQERCDRWVPACLTGRVHPDSSGPRHVRPARAPTPADAVDHSVDAVVVLFERNATSSPKRPGSRSAARSAARSTQHIRILMLDRARR